MNQLNRSTIEIHEFSTGIRPQAIATGAWVSLGFTGQYMNNTIDPIPEVVERSIANREFAVAEGASSDQPAIIGRVVGTGDDTWSVVAIVTKGRDEKGRGASMYRFFLTQGREKDGFQNLRLILTWWENQERPIFHPFDIQEVDKPHICDVEEISAKFHQVSQEAVAIPVNINEPILLTPQQEYDLQTINVLALKKYNTNVKYDNYQPFSWAYNVEALEKPERFLVIHAASEKAYQLLERAINKAPRLLISSAVTDEEAIKSAIRGLTTNSQIKPDNVKVIVEALQNNQLTSDYWHSLFDAQGATTAISQKIYSPQMVRLITLRAIVIPDTMLEFLSFLNIKPGQKPDENQAISLEFQKAIRRDLPKDKLANSIKSLLPELLKKSSKITPEGVKWLLVSNDSVWASGCKQFIEDIVADLQLIFSHLKHNTPPSSELYKCPPKTWEILIKNRKYIYSKSYSIKQEEYSSFAKLFESLEYYSLAAYFYQVSEGIVPKDVFEGLPHRRNSPVEILGLCIERETTFFESIIIFLLQEYIVPIQFVITLSIFLSLLSFTGGVLVGRLNNPKIAETVVSSSPTNTNGDQTEITNELKSKASNEFQKTQDAINEIINNIKKAKKNAQQSEIIKQIIEVLKLPENFEYDTTQYAGQKRNEFIEAIYKYQQNNGFNNCDGIISPKGETATKLEQDVTKKIQDVTKKTKANPKRINNP
ncbi:hypothetical protein H6F32_11425 [Anabaena sp. FACHB-1237]|uniref:hypothetical protein n=1 Tax=Anabaena sp. FACHB-1237 TaxID=2692769 RepID=UPI001680EDB2|nr:hypothetical protein [Anabaena sp. FACHB-1237]MBD2138185.1 hypothetical protein [Anabaena sp. FACHB-1237]